MKKLRITIGGRTIESKEIEKENEKLMIRLLSKTPTISKKQ